MRYYKQLNSSGVLLAIGTGLNGVEITKEEYDYLLATIRHKAALVDALYNGEITLAVAPLEWQEEIERRVNKRIAQQGAADDQDISAEEALDIILGGETV